MKTFTFSQTLTPRVRHLVSGHGGVNLATQEWGNPEGQPILFLHAFAMNHLFWHEQLKDPALLPHRLVTFDHRGHGESDKPLTPAAYNNADVWADDIHAVITARGLNKPILVGWSMSGALMLDYVAKHGEANVGGLVFLAAVNKLGGPMFASKQIGGTFADPRAQGIFSESLVEQVPAWNFVNRGLTSKPLGREAQDLILASSMLPPLAARTSTLTRDADHLPLLARLNAPILAVHAEDDDIVPTNAVEQLRGARPDAQIHRWPTGAHAPHWENAGKFNALLEGFVVHLELN